MTDLGMGLSLITVTGPDHPGIIAAVTAVLAKYNADIEDVSMTRLSGNFTMMLVARVPKSDMVSLLDNLKVESRSMGIQVVTEEIQAIQTVEDSNIFISAIGPNRVGIVSSLAALLAKCGANINEMTTRLLHRTAGHVYVVRIEATFVGDEEQLKSELSACGHALGIETRLEMLERVDL